MAKLNKTPLTIRSKRGTEAEITSYTGYQLSGEIAYATDTKDFYVSDGSQFNKIASFPFTGSAEITGSLDIIGDVKITGSLDMSGSINVTGDRREINILGDDGQVALKLNDSNTGATDTGKVGWYVNGNEYGYITAIGTPGIDGLLIRGNTNRGITFQTNGSNTRMRIQEDGNVGIGTTNPLQPLHVSGNFQQQGATNSIYMIDGGEIRGTSNLTLRSLGTFVAFQSAGSLFFQAADTERMRIDATTGNVGIGTTSPTSTLHISGSNNENLLLVESPSNNSVLFVTGSGNVGIGTSNPEYITDIQSPNQTNNIPAGDDVYNIFNVGYSNSNFNIANKSVFTVGATAQSSGRFVTEIRIGGGSDTNPHFIYYGNGEANGFRLDRSNNNLVLFNNVQGKGVIIKQTPDGLSSSARLQVRGDGTTDSTTSLLVENSNGDDVLKVTDDGAVSVSPDYNGGGFSVNSTQGIRSDSPSNASVKIVRNNNVGYFAMLNYFDGNSVMWQTGTPKNSDNADFAGTEYIIAQSSRSSPAITINTSDNVGIGSTNPTEKLTVEGNISASGDLAIQGFPSVSASLASSGGGGSAFPFTGSAQIQGLGTTSATTAFRVENANADEILKVTDDGALDMPTLSSGSNIGLVKRDGDAFFYRFSYGNNGTTTPLGRNIFIGKNTGNFTVGATAIQNYMGSDNIGVGDNALTNLTSGNRNIAIGQGVGASITTAGSNVMMGWGTGNSLTTGAENFLLGNFTGGSLTTHRGNVMIGTTVAQYIQGFYNVAIGDRALQGSGTNQNAGNNIAIGRGALQSIQAYSDSNVAIGSQALKNIGGNADGNIAIGYETGINNSGSAFDYNILIGYNVQAPLQNTGNQLNIGNLLYGTGVTSDQSVSTAGKIGIGQTTPDAKLHITGEGTTSATSALKIENATPTTIFDLKDNGQFTVGPSNGSISINSDGEVTISASNPALTIAGASQPNITFDGGQGSLTGLRTINRTGEIRINTTQGTRFGETSLSIGGIVDIVGKYDKVPLGIKQQAGTSQTRFATFLSSSGDEVLGITTDGGFYVRDSTLVKRYVFDHDYLPTHVDGLTTGLDFRTENQSGALTTFGYIDVTNDDSTLQESSMRFSVGQTTPTEVMRLQNDGNVGIGTTSPDASAILDIASTSKGVVFPRMTSAQRTAISSPTTGLIVYQTDATEGLYIYKSTGWVQII